MDSTALRTNLMKWFIGFVVVVMIISTTGNERTKKRLEKQDREIRELLRNSPPVYTGPPTYDELHDAVCAAGLEPCGGVFTRQRSLGRGDAQGTPAERHRQVRSA